jgi:hypothetical protein
VNSFPRGEGTPPTTRQRADARYRFTETISSVLKL